MSPYKPCKKCGCESVSGFHSTNEKYCHRCEEYSDWSLDEGQKPLFEGTAEDGEMSTDLLVDDL